MVKFILVRCIICSKFITMLLQSQNSVAVFVFNPLQFLSRAAELTIDCSVTKAWRASGSEDHHAGAHVLVSHEFAEAPEARERRREGVVEGVVGEVEVEELLQANERRRDGPAEGVFGDGEALQAAGALERLSPGTLILADAFGGMAGG